MEFKASSADVLWHKAYRSLISANKALVESRAGETTELSQVLLKLSDPRQRWVTQRSPAISIAFSLAEIAWIANRSNDARVINYWNPALAKYSGQEAKYHGAYGYRLGKEFGIDQLNRAYQALKNNPATRQVVLCYYDPKEDLPFSNGLPRSTDIPCNVVSLLKVRDGKLNWTQIMRSNDVIRGLPYNFVQFTFLQELLAGWLGLELGSYTHFSDSLHLYRSDESSFEECVPLKEKNTDCLNINKKQSDYWLAHMFSIMEKTAYANGKVLKEDLRNRFCLGSDIEALNNMMLIIGAYSARKNGFNDLESYFLGACTNKLYVAMWRRWKLGKNVS